MDCRVCLETLRWRQLALDGEIFELGSGRLSKWRQCDVKTVLLTLGAEPYVDLVTCLVITHLICFPFFPKFYFKIALFLEISLYPRVRTLFILPGRHFAEWAENFCLLASFISNSERRNYAFEKNWIISRVTPWINWVDSMWASSKFFRDVAR